MNRRSGAIFLLPLLGTTLFALLSFPDGEWGQWQWAVDLLTGTTVLTGPILAGCAAHLGWARARLDELVSTTPRAAWAPVRCALQAWSWGVIGYGIAGAAIAAVFLVRPHGGPFPLWAALIGLPVLGVAALTGALAARLFPYRVTVVLVGPLFFLFGAFGPSPYADLLRHGPSTGSLAGLEIARTYWGLQFGGLLALSVLLAGGLVIAARRSLAGRHLVVPVGLVVISLGVLIACGAVLDDPGRRRFEVSQERPTVCRGSAPRICVSPSSAHALPGAAAAMRRALGRLVAIGVGVPERYEERIPSYEPPESVGELVVDFNVDTLRAGARNAATPAGCSQWSDPRAAPESALQARELIVLWVRAREGEEAVSWSSKSDAWLARAATPAAADWVRTTFAQLRSCDFKDIRMPWTRNRQE